MPSAPLFHRAAAAVVPLALTSTLLLASGPLGHATPTSHGAAVTAPHGDSMLPVPTYRPLSAQATSGLTDQPDTAKAAQRLARPVAAQGQAPVKVTWPAAVVLDQPAAVTGDLSGASRRTVWLEQKYADGWRRTESIKTTRTGQFTLTVPTDWHYTMPTRVRVPETRLVSRPQKIRVAPAYTPLGAPGDWAYIDKKRVFRWNPCEPITYRINATQGPAHATDAIQAAVAAIEDGTGLSFKYAGTTTAIPWARKGGRDDHKGTDLVIAYATQKQVSVAITGHEALARGGATKAIWARAATGGKVAQIVSGGVVYDAARPYDYDNTVHVMMHELGHAVGLGHVSDTTQRMDGTGDGYRSTAEWGAGDLTGLNKVGAQQGCLSPIYR